MKRDTETQRADLEARIATLETKAGRIKEKHTATKAELAGLDKAARSTGRGRKGGRRANPHANTEEA